MNIKTLFITGLVVVLGSISVANAHEKHFTATAHSPQRSYEFRISAMTIYKWYLSPMGAMLKGKTKFNKPLFTRYAKGLATASELDLLSSFPKKSSEDDLEDSNAKPIIWTQLNDFEKKFQTFQMEAKKLANIANESDVTTNAIKAQFEITDGTCSSCHKAFKTK